MSAGADSGKLSIALGLIIVFMAVEVATGVIARSLALLSDAGHILTDAAAIGLSLIAARLAQRPAKGEPWRSGGGALRSSPPSSTARRCSSSPRSSSTRRSAA